MSGRTDNKAGFLYFMLSAKRAGFFLLVRVCECFGRVSRRLGRATSQQRPVDVDAAAAAAAAATAKHNT